ncbi:hypothetical protein [Curtobacterium sp. MCBD17_040]|uniref:S53 family peptidase n=1 Tax=Curtobacterium sp. MCBD17_040 TaxID=2175674 RepID=UPI0015E877C4|nr:hypothetical protein [Curtobacterium sp. MCBD17_040]WIB65314.1 hypothetical protein DEI94_18075 [Curtobacterium sp. MCBD17_040]
MTPTAVPGQPVSNLTGAYQAPASASAGAGATIATLQFSGWNSGNLKTYAAAVGRPAPSYTQISVDGASTTTATSKNGPFEVAIDQEALLDVAPRAAQRAYFADGSIQGMYDALTDVAGDVAQHDITALSISWMYCESEVDSNTRAVLEDAVDRVVAAGATTFAAAGDTGASCDGKIGASYPASSPAVISVGGTTLAKSGNTYLESVWHNSSGATGGGYSTFSRPSYQAGTGIGGNSREVPDISALADPNVGPGIYTDTYKGWVLGGGTSLATPLLAGELASTLSARGCTVGIGDIHNTLYAHPSDFRDVTNGSNGTYVARRGYDLATGLGTPNWAALSKVLPTRSGCKQVSPVGSFDAASAGNGTVKVTGWADDSSSSSSALAVKVTVGGATAGTLTANTGRSDVDKAMKISGNHGYSGTASTTATGAQQVCVTAVNVGAGADSLLGCKSVTFPLTSPEGSLDVVSAGPGTVSVAGWAFDQGDKVAADPVKVTFSNGLLASPIGVIHADQPRPDVDHAKNITGNHGFSGALPVSRSGNQQVCVTAENIGSAGHDTLLGCKNITLPDMSPQGSFDTASAATYGAVTVAGWAFDPSDTTTSTTVDATIGGVAAGTVATSTTRADVNRAKHVTGSHGFTGTLTTTKTGNQQVCLTAENTGSGSDKSLGCKTVTFPTNSPQGAFDTATSAHASVTVSGWAFDPDDTSQPVPVRVSVGGAATPAPLSAAAPRADVDRAKSITGNHGYTGTVTTTKTGKQQVCVTAINFSHGSDTNLGCKSVTIR